MEKKSCCENPPAAAAVSIPKTKTAFIEEKLRNFQKYLSDFAKTPELQKELTQFDSVEQVLPYLATLIPIYKAGKMDVIVKGFCDKFETTDEAFKVKCSRYVECFCETLLG